MSPVYDNSICNADPQIQNSATSEDTVEFERQGWVDNTACEISQGDENIASDPSDTITPTVKESADKSVLDTQDEPAEPKYLTLLPNTEEMGEGWVDNSIYTASDGDS